jgi:hypothetical protein
MSARVEMIRTLEKQGIEMIRTDYEKNLSKYVKRIDAAKLAAIIKACGIALKGLDSQYVSITDPAEVGRVAKGFGAKRLGLSAAATTKGLAKVGTLMKAERSKLRTTVYYLLAQQTGTLGKLGTVAPKKATKKAIKSAAKKVAKKTVKKAAKKKAKKKVKK